MYRVYHSPSLLVLLSLVMSLLRAVCADWERVCTPFTRSFGAHPGGICGHRLDEMLDVLCVDGYNQYPSQSSGYGGYFRRKRHTKTDDGPSLRDIVIPKSEANAYLSRQKRSSYYNRGIVCECCFHRCDIMELLSYCRTSGPDYFGLFKRSADKQTDFRRHQRKMEND
ncbi:con-Ins Im2-like [Mya arenaria]|uniref:con-Ins Im2-like n=1 Tax=Mya arenaria TaxID=6604 RepID=UPI0022E51192|nr:con-Ins Im2-like [Mya arenaria]XP_052808152.1 con-Ins Im2-like [Mya arenaria]XP_052808154.1 con-Ins Im2-like [Mya arenaria]